mgnify:CR=1 FL=1
MTPEMRFQFSASLCSCFRPLLVMEPFVKLLSPFAPHLGEELWNRLGHAGTIAYELFCALAARVPVSEID